MNLNLLKFSLVWLCCVQIAKEPAADEVSLAGDFGEPRVIVPAPADAAHAHLSWPKISRTPAGTLVLAYVAGEFHGTHGGGCPAFSVSKDGGKTFTPPHVLQQYSASDEYTSAGNVALGLAEDGSVVLLSMAYNGKLANTIDGWRSTDEGVTWKRVDTSKLAKNQTGSVYGNVISVPEQGLAVVGHYRRGSTAHINGLWLSWSKDNGQSWAAPRLIVDRGLVEPAVVFSQDRFIGLIRAESTPDYYEQIVSKDGGQNWEVKVRGLASTATGPIALPSPCLVTDPEHPGRLVALVNERYGPKHPSGLLGRIVLWEANAEKLQWHERGVVANFPSTLRERNDFTYAWLAPLGENRWYVVFYCGRMKGASDLYGFEITLPAK